MRITDGINAQSQVAFDIRVPQIRDMGEVVVSKSSGCVEISLGLLNLRDRGRNR